MGIPNPAGNYIKANKQGSRYIDPSTGIDISRRQYIKLSTGLTPEQRVKANDIAGTKRVQKVRSDSTKPPRTIAAPVPVAPAEDVPPPKRKAGKRAPRELTDEQREHLAQAETYAKFSRASEHTADSMARIYYSGADISFANAWQNDPDFRAWLTDYVTNRPKFLAQTGLPPRWADYGPGDTP